VDRSKKKESIIKRIITKDVKRNALLLEIKLKIKKRYELWKKEIKISLKCKNQT
jgi:hypothetical protein